MTSREAVLGVLFLTLVACGGGSGGSGEGSGMPPPSPVANYTKTGGSWSGQFTTDGIAGADNVRGVISERGDGILLSSTATFLLKSVSGVDGNATFVFTGYAFENYTFADGTQMTEGTFDGLVVERGSINGSWSTDSGDSGNVSLSFRTEYDIDSSITTLAGIYTSDYIGTLVIDPDGTFFLQDFDGCTLNGVAGEIDTDYNLYDMSFDIGNCGQADSYVTGYVAHFSNGNNERIEVTGVSELGFVYFASFFQFN